MAETTKGLIALVLLGFVPPVIAYWMARALVRRLTGRWEWKQYRALTMVVPIAWWIVFGLWILRGDPWTVIVVALMLIPLAFLYGHGLEGWADYFARRRQRRRQESRRTRLESKNGPNNGSA
jgi:Zn-dependent protease with chaperone function